MRLRAILNLPNPFDSYHRELLEPTRAGKLLEDEGETREILSNNDRPHLPFR